MIMKTLVIMMLALSSFVSWAHELPKFQDRGVAYNPMKFKQVIKTGDGAYTIEFYNDEESYFTNFIVTSDGVVAFDPLSDSAAIEYAKLIKQYAPEQPLLAIIYSHLHTDHISGARVLRHYFGKNVPIIAHENVKEYFQYWQVPFVDLPTETVNDQGKTFKFGNRTVDLKYIGDAHTSSILVPVVRELKMAYVCDFANNNVVGWTDLPGIDIDEMMKMQRNAAKLDVEVVTFCHGKPGTTASIDKQVEYFEAVMNVARKAKRQGLTENEAAASIDLPQYHHFANYEDWFEGNVRAMYRWVD